MRQFTYIVAVFISVLIIASCGQAPEEQVIEVVAKDFKFEVVDSIPSGWNTLRFVNTGHTEHFFLLNLLPDSISYDRYESEVTRNFEDVFDSIRAGTSREDAIAMLIERIPPWYFSSVQQMGGPGIVSEGMTTSVTLDLPPGTYAMECYIKEQGKFHTELGMIRPIVVTEEPSGLQPPEANLELTLSNFEYTAEGAVTSGSNTVAVHFNEHPEVGLGNDVHLIELTDSTNLDSVIYWLDWMNVEGLQSPSPVKFFGGSQEMPVGNTAYFTVYLRPGKYAWIAESSAARGMVKEFTVY